MRALIQRVADAACSVDGVVSGQIDAGLLVYVGITPDDTATNARKLAQKVAGLRIFDDADDKLNLSVQDVGGAILVIPNFTLLADARKGRRPAFNGAAPGPVAQPLQEAFVAALREEGVTVAEGVFGADMTITSTGRGPINVIVDIE